MHVFSRTLALGLALAATACASTSVTRPVASRGSNSNVLVNSEIVATAAANAYDAIQSLRPNWLRTRGSHSLQNRGDDYIVVYLNNARLGPPTALRQISAADVGQIRYYDAAAANYRFGVGHTHGAIQVLSEGSIR